MKEVFKAIDPVEFPGYDISNHGMIRSHTGKVTSGIMNAKRVMIVRIKNKDGIYKVKTVANLVAKVFLNLPKRTRIVRHKDDDPRNNNVRNLYYIGDDNNRVDWNTLNPSAVKTVSKSDGISTLEIMDAKPEKLVVPISEELPSVQSKITVSINHNSKAFEMSINFDDLMSAFAIISTVAEKYYA